MQDPGKQKNIQVINSTFIRCEKIIVLRLYNSAKIKRDIILRTQEIAMVENTSTRYKE